MAAITPLTTLKVIDPVDQNGYKNADIVKAIYNIKLAIAQICTELDASGTGYVTGVSTTLDAALANLHTPTGPTYTTP